MSQKHILIHTPPSEWKLPLNLAVGLHLLVLFCAMVLPGLLNQRTILPEITTVDLVSIGAPSAPSKPAAPTAAKKHATNEAKQKPVKQEAAPPVPPKPAETIKPEAVKQIPPPIAKPVSVPLPKPVVAPEPVAPPAPADAISIKPLKQKLKKVIKEIPDTRVEDAKIRKDELKSITKKLQEEAKQEAKREETAQETIKRQRQQAAAREETRRRDLAAREEVKRLDLAERETAADARNAVADQIRTSTSASDSQASPQTGPSNDQNMGIAEQQYRATLKGHIQPYWQPPDVKSWDPNIVVLVTITIASNGQIVSQVIDQGSGDKLFDQFVLKTLEDASPVPPLPPAMQKQRYEIGLRFKPSGIQ